MLLRSSSTPALGSLVSSISESPNHHHHHHYQPEVQPHTANKPPPPPIPHAHKKLLFHQSPSQNFTTFSCNSSPISSLAEFSGGNQTSFRRAQSEANLESLANTSSQVDEFSLSKPPVKFARKPNSSLLQTIPSSSFYNMTSSYEDEDSDDENEDEERFEFEKNGLPLNNSFGGQKRSEGEKKRVMGLNEGMIYGNLGFEEATGGDSQQMYLARGLGVTAVFDSGYGSGGDGDGTNVGYGGDGGGTGGTDGGKSLEEYYKKMVEENPGNPLFLRNYAQFLYQTKGDLQRAEEYYSRAILADSEDGEILSQYASLIWELHRDEDRAVSYFERAVQTASEDSHVHAAYANFLWQIEDEDEEEEEEEEEDGVLNHPQVVPPLLHTRAMASASA